MLVTETIETVVTVDTQPYIACTLTIAEASAILGALDNTDLSHADPAVLKFAKALKNRGAVVTKQPAHPDVITGRAD